jgi:hypothetical protein
MAFQVDRSGRQRQNFGNPAAAQTQYETKELHLQGTRRTALMKRANAQRR